MKYFYLFLIPFFILSCKNGKRGSGNIIKQTRKISSINALNVSGPIQVIIDTGAVPKLDVESDDNIMEYVETASNNNTLTIKLKEINNLRNATIKIHLVIPALKSITASASANVHSNKTMPVNEMVIFKASSSSEINFSVNAPIIKTEASSGATIVLEGKTRELDAEGSSGSNIDLSLLKSETANASASSGSKITLFASITLKAAASSGGNIKYRGGAALLNNNISSGGSINAY